MQTEPETILIIEDDLKFGKLMKLRLESAGYWVRVIENGLDGLCAARSFRPDLILLDIMLPGLDGHRISRLLKRDRRLKGIPIVMLTSLDLSKDRHFANDTGVDDYLIKTEPFENVLATVRKVINQNVRSNAAGMIMSECVSGNL